MAHPTHPTPNDRPDQSTSPLQPSTTLLSDPQIPPDSPSPKPRPRLQSRLFWLFALVAHAPLTITFYDAPNHPTAGTQRVPGATPTTNPQSAIPNPQSPIPIARLTLDDFSPQLSTQLSPTAGWLLPANSIEFSLQSDKPSAAAALFLSLSSTSPGRGYDSLGHSPGTYRNRLHLQLLPPPTTQPK